MKDKRGFTLVEILAVLLILGLLMTIAIPSIFSISNRINRRGLETKLEIIEDAAVVYAQNNSNKIKSELGGTCTSNTATCECDRNDPTDCKYIFRVSLDKLITLGAVKSEKTSEDILVCDILDPSDKNRCLDCGTIVVRLDDKYKTATAKYVWPEDETILSRTNCN